MALAIDSQEASTTGHHSTTSPLTWTFTNTAGTLLMCGIVVTNSTGLPTIGTVSYNGVAMTPFGTGRSWDSPVSEFVQWFSLLSPATGAHTMSVAYTPVGSIPDAIAGCISFTGNNTSTPVINETTAFSNTNSPLATVTMSGTTSGNYLLACVGTGTGVTGAHSGDGTLTWKLNVSTGTAGDNAGALYLLSGGGSATVAFDVSSDEWGLDAVEIQAAGGGATKGLFLPTPMTGLGVGGPFFPHPIGKSARLAYARRGDLYVPERLAT
jgi:hypothetical protein